MSFHDGVPMASILDGIDLKSIVMVLEDHQIFVGPSILNNREYLYYFIGNCNDIRQDAVRNDIVRRFHRVDQVCLKLSMSLCITGHPLHTARLVELFGYVEATVRGHHKDGIVEALRIYRNKFFLQHSAMVFWMTRVEEFEEARTLVKDHRLNSTLPVFRPDITVVDVLNGLPLRRACEILESLHDVPTEMTYRKDVFIQFCAILPLNISDQFVLELKREYENRIHYAKRLRIETQTDEESFMCPVNEELHGWWYS
ncbi:hypothetical protein EDD18DRAFT_1384057 [Armillaria luteobubalina]|uniref:Uncharacterized protein n=1 Tax=Armillaria luteobubalina TaxID=153913 RepID=A0AA39Q995_9AGAR|nr:hypothetical protein EDD18DRAFT_1384057 [Armillaria luteobubalina]